MSSGRRDRSRSPTRRRLASRGSEESGHRPGLRARDPRMPRGSFEERGTEVSPIEIAHSQRGDVNFGKIRDTFVKTASRMGRPSVDKPLYRFREDVVSSICPPPPPSVTLFSKDPSTFSHPDSSTGNDKFKEHLVDVEADLHRWIQTNDPSCSSGDILRVKAYKFAKGRDLDVDISHFSEDWFKNFKKRFVEGGSYSGSGCSGGAVEGKTVGLVVQDETGDDQASTSAGIRKKSFGAPGQAGASVMKELKAEIGTKKSNGGTFECSDSGVLVNTSEKKETL